MSKTISILNQKGGVGKTTTTLNLGKALTILGKKVLLIDADSQGHLTLASGLNKKEVNKTLANLITYHIMEQDKRPEMFIQTTEHGFDVLSSNRLLAGLSSELQDKSTLKAALNGITNGYDYILIDCMPTIGPMTTNCVYASDSVIIPMEAEQFSVDGFVEVVSSVMKVKEEVTNKTFDGIIWNFFNPKHNNSREMAGFIKEAKTWFNFPIPEFVETIPDTVLISEAVAEQKTIFDLKTKRKEAKDNVCEKYLSIAKELIAKEGK